jgi:uncharacterized C2H2 Zn-finger protein
MIPKIHAKFRKRQGVPYAIEQLCGRQFRCRHCNEVFLTEKELDRHIKNALKSDDRNKFRVDSSTPKLSSNIMVKVFYSYDLTDKIKQQWLKLKKGDEYDGI